MCEKPISTDLAATAAVIAKAESKPHLKFLVPFTRRYDDSHQAVKIMADAGSLGEVHAVEATCVDVQDPNGKHSRLESGSILTDLPAAFFVAFSPFSGGLFLDCGIHVVDVGRWYLEVASGISNPLKQCRRVVGMGQTAVYSDLQQFGDADNAWGMVEFENGSVLTMHLSRTSTNGFEASTRVHGTKSHALINGNSALNRVELRDAYGVRITNPQDAFTLYDKTFVSDLAEFATGVLDGRPFSCNPEDAYEAGKIAIALQHSFRTGEPVYFDEEGQPILKAMDANGHSSGVVKAANGHVNGVKKVANGITNGVANGIVNGH